MHIQEYRYKNESIELIQMNMFAISKILNREKKVGKIFGWIKKVVIKISADGIK